MWFLLLEIFPLLALATVFGAVLAHWWLKRSYEDVTDSYASLMQMPDLTAQGFLTKFDFESGMANLKGPDLSPVEHRLGNLERAINAIALPETDLSPVEARMMALETAIHQLQLPETDLSPLEERLLSLESLLANPQADRDIFNNRLIGLESSLSALHTATSGLQNTDTDRLERQMDIIATAIAERKDTDLSPIEARLAGLEDAISAIDTSDIDLGPIHSGLTRLEMSLANLDMPEPDFSPLETRLHTLREDLSANRDLDEKSRETLHQRLTALSASVDALRNPDFNPIIQRLDDIETRIAHFHIPETDLRPLDEGLSIIHGRLANLEAAITEAPEQAVDLSALEQRLDRVQTELARLERIEGTLGTLRMDVQQSITDLDPLQHRLDDLKQDMTDLPAPDLTPVLNSLYAMERRMDFAAMENRLTSIEYGLAALHHMLRSRQTQDAAYRAAELSTPAQAPPPVFTAPPPREPYRGPQQASYTPPPPPRETWPEPAPQPPNYETRRRGYDYEPASVPSTPRADKISQARRPDDRANLLVRPAFGAPDDLEEISGVGPMLHGLLTEIGVYYFWQIAEWGPREIEWVDDMLDGFKGRILRDDWVGQARMLASGKHAARRP